MSTILAPAFFAGTDTAVGGLATLPDRGFNPRAETAKRGEDCGAGPRAPPPVAARRGEGRPALAKRFKRALSVAIKVTRTRAVPCRLKPNNCAARLDRSIIRPWAKGPRSLTRMTIDRPFTKLVTCTTLGMGRVRCAAETSFWSKISPLAVFLP